mgnify:CR=1 FL=1
MERLAPNTVVDRYVVERSLGTGGMATVYLVRHQRLGTAHALKLLHVPTAAIRERLMQEGRIQGGLHHPNVVNVTDVVDWMGAPGLIMEFVDGPALDGFLLANRLSVEQADALARGLITGVGAAHKQGLVHRDLKPGNILLRQMDDDIVPKITDFGLVKLQAVPGGEGIQQTRSGIAMGTPSYMAPEQIRDAASVDHRADIFSLGAILYELVAGRRAFEGEDMIDIWDRIRDGDYPPLETQVVDLPERMRRAIEGALQVNRDERVADCQALLELWTGGDPSPLRSGIWDETTLDQLRALSPSSMPPPELTTGALSAETFDYASAPDSVDDPTLAPTPTHSADVTTERVRARGPSSAPGSRSMKGFAALGLVLAAITGAAAVGWWDYNRVKIGHYAHVEAQISGVKLWRPLSSEERQRFVTHYEVRSQRGRVMSFQQLNGRGNPAIGDEFAGLIYGEEERSDNAISKLIYDEQGRMAELKMYDPSGEERSTNQVEWVAADKARFRAMDAHGRQLTTNGGGYTQEWTLNDQGQPVEGRTLDVLGENTVPSTIDGSSGVRVEVDDKGRELRSELVDNTGEGMRDRDGAMVRIQEFADPDHPWLPTRISAMGFGGAPAMAIDGCAQVRMVYRDGYTAEQSCWAGDEPMLNNGGCHAVRQERTPERRLLTCLGPQGQPVTSVLNVAMIETTYDDNGYPSRYRALDVDGNPATLRQGYSSWTTVYDEHGIQLQQGPLYRADGKPEVDALTRAAVTRGTYQDGNLVEITYHDEAGKLAMTRFGFAVRRYEIEGGLPLGWRLFDQDGEPTTSIWAITVW